MGKKKTPRQKIVDKLDTAVSLYIRARDQRCVVCGSPDNPSDGHVFSRGHYSLRWDIRPDGNNHQQCWGCNYRHVRDQQPYFDWYINKFGLERWRELRREWADIKKISTAQLEDLYEKIKGQ